MLATRTNATRFFGVIVGLALGAGRPLPAQGPGAGNIVNASIEDLMKIDVTSVSKKEQTLSKTPAAVFVINREDIRRSGAVNIPDLLRMAPGVEVAQISANEWAISIRGFNAIYSNKVLVLIDGRSVYVDQFSGVYWDQIDVPLENIERIEVIRGPGGTVWGANAVNGIVNIITSSAAETKGGLIVAGGGNRQTAGGLLQYGGDAGSKGAYRVFGKYFNDNNSPAGGGHSSPDGWHSSHMGFRSDWALSSRDTLSVQGDLLTASGGETWSLIAGTPPVQGNVTRLLTNHSGDVLGRWEHTLANGSQTSLQVSESVISRSEAGVHVSDNALDVEFEHHFVVGSRQDIVWGLDYRLNRTNLQPMENQGLRLDRAKGSTSLFAGFVQDEIRIAPTLFLTLGTKIEHNGYTGLEYEPGAQLVWTKSAKQSFWASISRAIREPDGIEHGVRYNLNVVPVPGLGNAIVVLRGNSAVQAERLTDYEVGYRSQLNARISLDATGFLSYYQKLVTHDMGDPSISFSGYTPMVTIPLNIGNLASARDYGVEVFANWQATNRWRISPGFSALRMSIARDKTSTDPAVLDQTGDSPRQQFEVRSQLKVRRNVQWDSSLKYVGQLSGQGIPSYVRLDTRLGWNAGEFTEFSVAGQNLVGGRRLELVDNSGLFTQAQVGRTILGKVTFRF